MGANLLICPALDGYGGLINREIKGMCSLARRCGAFLRESQCNFGKPK